MEAVATGEIRVSDQERDQVAGEVREHYAVGRLSDEELHQRLDATYRARTRHELQAVTRDLPGPAPTDRGERYRRLYRRSWGRYLRVNAICWTIWGASIAATPGHQWQGMWPLWVTLPWGAALMSHRSRRRS